MAKFTKSVEKKGAAAAAPAKIAAGVQKNKNKKGAKPAVAPAVKAAVVAEAKAAKPSKAVAPVAKPAVAAVKAAKVAKPAKKSADGVKQEKSLHSVFVGNLPAKVKRNVLTKLFAPHAAVQSVRFRKNNGGKIFKQDLKEQTSIIAFVDVATVAEARAAAAALNGTKLAENVLRVDVQAGSKNAANVDAKRTAFIGNLPFTTSDSQLRKFFADAGKIDYVRINQSKKGCNGTAFVCFKDAASVVEALKLNGKEFGGRAVRINRSEKKQVAQEAAKRPAEDKKAAVKAAAAVVEEAEEEDEDEVDDDEDIVDEDDEEDDSEEEEEVAAPPPAKKAAKPAAKAPKAAPANNKAGKKGGKKA